MITREMIEKGFQQGVITLENESDNGCVSLCCQIGRNAFYFTDEDIMTAEEYLKANPLSSIINSIFEILKDDESAEEHCIDETERMYYEWVLKDNVMCNLHWYELCFFGDEDDSSITDTRACSYVIKTEIPPIIDDKVALSILFGDMPTDDEKELINNCTCVMEVTEDEAKFFDVEDLTERVASYDGVYYRRKRERNA
jgi:hypothetical protein